MKLLYGRCLIDDGGGAFSKWRNVLLFMGVVFEDDNSCKSFALSTIATGIEGPFRTLSYSCRSLDK